MEAIFGINTTLQVQSNQVSEIQDLSISSVFSV